MKTPLVIAVAELCAPVSLLAQIAPANYAASFALAGTRTNENF